MSPSPSPSPAFTFSGTKHHHDPAVGGAYLADLFARVGAGTIHLPIHAEHAFIFSADGVRQAQAALVGGASAGKVLIKVT